ncbi:MAG: hypothetical protein NW223_13835, partial [Hyphomicrobiaceae bacterium]|nr:hypothetical protein [Hyphomicrobiaceae bacterium]
MAYPEGLRRCRPALLVALLLLPAVAAAETGGSLPRSGPRLSPLGAGGAVDPIAVAVRHDEIRIAAAASAPRPSLIDRLVRGAP